MARAPQSTPFLLLSKARTLSLKDVFAMGDDGAHEFFCKMRWPETDGAPVCPRAQLVGSDPFQMQLSYSPAPANRVFCVFTSRVTRC